MSNPMDSIQKAFRDLSNTILDEGIEDAQKAREWMISKSPGFRNDKIFNDIFEIVFMIELIKRKSK